MKEQFVPYEIALAMKELGFDNVSCLAVYYGDYTIDEREVGYEEEGFGFVLNSRSTQYYAQKGFQNGILAPLYQQAFNWFREEHDHIATPTFNRIVKYKFDIALNGGDSGCCTKLYDTYEEAQDACLKKLIELVKEK